MLREISRDTPEREVWGVVNIFAASCKKNKLQPHQGF